MTVNDSRFNLWDKTMISCDMTQVMMMLSHISRESGLPLMVSGFGAWGFPEPRTAGPHLTHTTNQSLFYFYSFLLWEVFMSKKKLSLSGLHVQSFLTRLPDSHVLQGRGPRTGQCSLWDHCPPRTELCNTGPFCTIYCWN